MKKFFVITLFAMAFVGALLMTLFVKTTTANADIAAGNQAYVAKNYDLALQHYTAAQGQAPAQVEPAYNAANTYYRQNLLDKAQQSLEPALSHPQGAIAEFVRFNLGDIAFNAKQFDAAIAQYEEALRLQPNDRDAKYNLELALQQKQQQDQQKQQQNQDQQKQDQQNQQDQNQQQQSQSGGQQDQQQHSSNPQNQQNQQKQSGGQPDQQQPPDQQNGQQSDQQKQQNQPDQQNSQQGDQQNQPQQNQQQGPPAGKPNQQQPNQPDGQAFGARSQPGLTPEQAKQLLAAIGGNSKTLLEKLQLMYMASGNYPDQDW